jgi:hypothetical protein
VLACLLLLSHAADAKGTTFPWLFNKFHGQPQLPEAVDDGSSNSGGGDSSACPATCKALGDASDCDCSGCSCPEASCISAAMVCRRGNMTHLQLSTSSCGAGGASLQLVQGPATPGALQLVDKTTTTSWKCEGMSCCSAQPGAAQGSAVC